MITALVEIDTDRGRAPRTAAAHADIEGVAEVWSVTGDHDLVAPPMIAAYDRLDDVPTARTGAPPGVARTTAMLAFEEAWTIGVE